MSDLVLVIDDDAHFRETLQLALEADGLQVGTARNGPQGLMQYASDGPWDLVLVDQRMQFVGTIVRRSMYEQLGGFRPELTLCPDWDMWKRVAVHAPI